MHKQAQFSCCCSSCVCVLGVNMFDWICWFFMWITSSSLCLIQLPSGILCCVWNSETTSTPVHGWMSQSSGFSITCCWCLNQGSNVVAFFCHALGFIGGMLYAHTFSIYCFWSYSRVVPGWKIIPLVSQRAYLAQVPSKDGSGEWLTLAKIPIQMSWFCTVAVAFMILGASGSSPVSEAVGEFTAFRVLRPYLLVCGVCMLWSCEAHFFVLLIFFYLHTHSMVCWMWRRTRLLYPIQLSGSPGDKCPTCCIN